MPGMQGITACVSVAREAEIAKAWAAKRVEKIASK
jgi:hypothetical protein